MTRAVVAPSADRFRVESRSSDRGCPIGVPHRARTHRDPGRVGDHRPPVDRVPDRGVHDRAR
ncbi:hypothetical protein GCM10011588_47470 [Nocardia jinanensis]|uniref:Uncharacterized protein n=1 Tax=Nocardia jinanensis TaxID=382504 RepID=A0A917RT45_9NOCA|nr:hypothetical protein GCM10011588_47470 [Nocardia jinanensis]